MKKQIGERAASHIVARVSGVKASDTKVEAAQKAVDLMRAVWGNTPQVRKAERMLAEMKRGDR